MAMMLGEKRLTPYYGDGRPVNVYQNGKKLAGWREAVQTGLDLPFDDTYNDVVDVIASGRSQQPVDNYREVSSSNIIPITAHKENVLRKCRIDTLAQQTPMYYREPTPTSGVLSFSDNNETVARKAIVSTVAKQTVCVKGTNLVTNGDFSNGLTGWLGNRRSLDNGRCYFNETASDGYLQQGELAAKLNYTDIFYISFVMDRISGTLNLFNSFGAFSTSGRKAWRGVINAGVNLSDILDDVSPYYYNGWIDNIIIFNLTAEFGAGKEPTAAAVDAMLSQYPNSWFDGTNVLTTDITTYTANSPSIKYPAPIFPAVAAGGSVKVGRRAKNYCDAVLNYTGAYSSVPHPVKQWTAFDGKTGTYTLSAYLDASGSALGGLRLQYEVYATNGSTVESTNYATKLYYSAAGRISVSFSIPNGRKVRLSINRSPDYPTDTNIVAKEVQLEAGASATPYEAYSGADYAGTFQNAAYGLSGAPDTRDLVSGKETHNTGLKTFDGSVDEVWNLYEDSNGFVTFATNFDNVKKGYQKSISNLFPNIDSIWSQSKLYEGMSDHTAVISKYFKVSRTRIGVTDSDTKTDKITKFRSFLGANNLVVVYQLETSTIISNTPQTIALNTTLNNCFSDTGTLMVAYQVKPGSNIAGDILSPHPDYPAPISPAIALGGSGKIGRRGKNWFNKNSSAIDYIGTTLSQITNGIRVTTLVAGSYKYAIIPIVGWKKLVGSSVTLGATAQVIGSTGSSRIVLAWRNTSSGGISSVIASSNSIFTVIGVNAKTFTMPNPPDSVSDLVLLAYTAIDGSSPVNDYAEYINIQLEQGASATAYEPYSGSDTTLTPQAAMYGLTGAVDSIGADGKEKHPTAKYTITGNETDWGYNAPSNFVVRIPSTSKLATDACISNRYAYTSSAFGTSVNDGICTSGNYAYITDKRFTDLAAFKVNVQSNNIDVVYQLATPTTYTNAAQTIALADGANNVFSDVGTLNLSYQVPDGQNIAGDIASPTPDYPAIIIPSQASIYAENADASRQASMDTGILRAIPNGAGGWIARDTETIEWVGGARHLIRTENVARCQMASISALEWNGTDWFATNERRVLFGVDPPKKVGNSTLYLFSHGKVGGYSVGRLETYGLNAIIYWYPNYTQMGLTGAETKATATATMRAWVTANAPYFDYVRATPSITDLGPVDLPTYYRHTRIRTSGSYTPDIQVTVKVTDTAV